MLLRKGKDLCLSLRASNKKEWSIEGRIRKEGVPINPSLQKDLKVMQEELKLNQYAFPC